MPCAAPDIAEFFALHKSPNLLYNTEYRTVY